VIQAVLGTGRALAVCRWCVSSAATAKGTRDRGIQVAGGTCVRLALVALLGRPVEGRNAVG